MGYGIKRPKWPPPSKHIELIEKNSAMCTADVSFEIMNLDFIIIRTKSESVVLFIKQVILELDIKLIGWINLDSFIPPQKITFKQ